MSRIPFGQWLPDVSPFVKQTDLDTATNVIPEIDGYSCARGIMPITAALGSACLNGVWYADYLGAAQTFVGTASKLYKRATPTTWTDFSKVGGYTSSDWQFARWGNKVVACNGYNATQATDMTSGTVFADLTNAPIAGTVGTVGDFLVFGNTLESAVAYPNRVRWSGFNNAETYGSSLATQADYQDLIGNGGDVQRIVPGPVGVVFQERSIWVMEYSGPPTVFRFSEIERARGTPAKNSVCWLGEAIFFYAHDGFHVFALGAGVKPIGRGKVDRWFLANADTTRLDEMHGAVDRERGLVFWSFASRSAGTTADRMLVYSITADKWTVVELNTECIFEVYGPGYNLDTLDTILADIDTASINVESRAFLEGSLMLGVVGSDHKLGTMEDDPLTATVQTGESGGDRKRLVRRIRGLVTGGTSRAKVGYRDELGENVNWSLWKTENARGVIPVRSCARYHTYRLEIADGFDRIHGMEVDAA